MKSALLLLLLTLISCHPKSNNGLDATPKLTSVSLSSDNAKTNYAKTGNVVTLSFSSDAPLKEYEVIVNNENVPVTSFDQTSFYSALTVTDTMREGRIEFSIHFTNLDGVKGKEVFSTTDSSSVTIKNSVLPPASISLVNPESPSGVLETPTFLVSGVEENAEVSIFSDQCSTKKGSVTSSGTSVQVTSSSLETGDYTFYASQTDFLGNTSECTAINASYKKIKQPFISKWRTTTPNETITIPLKSGFTYNMTVNWGDGTPEQEILSNSSPNRSHIYAEPGIYTITISGSCPSIGHGDRSMIEKLLEVENLGDVGWTDLASAFYGAKNLTLVFGGNTSQVTTMAGMFESATEAIPDTSQWDTSRVTNMNSMFFMAKKANPDTSKWNVGNVREMHYMFSYTEMANPDVKDWDISNVTGMAGMFSNAKKAQPETGKWDTSKVETMASMFDTATVANPDVGQWNTSNVKNMASMFAYAPNAYPDVSEWDTSKVTDFSNMFSYTNSDPDVSRWNTISAKNMKSIFYRSNANPDVTNWDTRNVTDMSVIFMYASKANPDLSGWDFSSVTTMDSILESTSSATSENYSKLLIRLAEPQFNHLVNIRLGAFGKKYRPEAAAARAELVSRGWIFNDSGQE